MQDPYTQFQNSNFLKKINQTIDIKAIVNSTLVDVLKANTASVTKCADIMKTKIVLILKDKMALLENKGMKQYNEFKDKADESKLKLLDEIQKIREQQEEDAEEAIKALKETRNADFKKMRDEKYAALKDWLEQEIGEVIKIPLNKCIKDVSKMAGDLNHPDIDGMFEL